MAVVTAIMSNVSRVPNKLAVDDGIYGIQKRDSVCQCVKFTLDFNGLRVCGDLYADVNKFCNSRLYLFIPGRYCLLVESLERLTDCKDDPLAQDRENWW